MSMHPSVEKVYLYVNMNGSREIMWNWYEYACLNPRNATMKMNFAQCPMSMLMWIDQFISSPFCDFLIKYPINLLKIVFFFTASLSRWIVPHDLIYHYAMIFVILLYPNKICFRCCVIKFYFTLINFGDGLVRFDFIELTILNIYKCNYQHEMPYRCKIIPLPFHKSQTIR